MKAAYPVIVGTAIRLALAPFFVYAWDMTTVMLSAHQFLSGVNPYAYVMQQSAQHIQAAGLPVPYYGFAYLATTLMVYAPFYALYLGLGFVASPLVGWQGQLGQTPGLVYPDAFYMLFLLKLPVIAADAVAIYLLHRRSGRAGWTYALSPYMIFITSIWGNFDSLVGVLLLVSYLAFEKNKAASGFVYGLSMMKIYTVVAAPAFLFKLCRKPRDLVAFVAGATLANLPSLYYLVSDPNSFLFALGFQATRPTNGVSIFYALVDVRSIFIELSLTRVIMVLLVVALAVAAFKIWRSGLELKESIVLLMLVYMVFAPVVNEQLLAALVSLGLLSRNFSHRLTVFPLVYIAFNATYFYYAVPILFQTASLQGLYRALNGWWNTIVGAYVIQARYAVGAAMGVACLLLARSTFEGSVRVRLNIPRLHTASVAPVAKSSESDDGSSRP